MYKERKGEASAEVTEEWGEQSWSEATQLYCGRRKGWEAQRNKILLRWRWGGATEMKG
jgi:hypothetical protein